jgi:hypothetical protein
MAANAIVVEGLRKRFDQVTAMEPVQLEVRLYRRAV